MYLLESKGGAIVCVLVSLLFLGTWPAVQTLLERRGRLPQHTYLDYTMSNFLAAVIIALTFGQIGGSSPESPNFILQLSQYNSPSVMLAMAGVIVLSVGNVPTQYAWAFAGLWVTEVVTLSITVVIGTTLNYFLDDRINGDEILFPGVACFLVAVCLGSVVHSSKEAIETEGDEAKERKNPEDKVQLETADFLIEIEDRRSKVFVRSILIGLAMTFFACVCFSLFSPAFNLATSDQWHALKKEVPHLVVFTAFFYFSLTCFMLILNVIFLYRPVLGLPKSSLTAYLNDWDGGGWSVVAGLLCGFGNGLRFMNDQAAGYVAADAVQALLPMSTFWVLLLSGEYRKSSRRTYVLLGGMLFMFIGAVGMLMASSGHRK